MNYEARREKLYSWMNEEGISLVVFADNEASRNPSVRYLCGHPNDALLVLSIDKKSLLIPWDNNMAALYAKADNIIPYTKFDLDQFAAVEAAAAYFKTPYGSKIEIPNSTSYPNFLKYVERLSGFDVLCRNDGAGSKVEQMRSIKDEIEIDIYRKLSVKTNEIIALLEEAVPAGTLKSEADVALFIEVECRKRGCDGVGFTTLAAGPDRSFGIHCFPAWTSAAFGTRGLSILDFGLVYNGYTSDVTMTFANSPSKVQQKQLELVEDAAETVLSMLKKAFSPQNEAPMLLARDTARAVDSLFKKSGVFMPHGLGHGIGLEPHEEPFLRRAASNTRQLECGNIITVEPGLYDPVHGGCRLENDVLLSEQGAEVLTKSKIVRW
ncbi:MAG: hypothetical protein Pg6A_15630 [Termitinemataceae bacterium]|nr:MAG: hypothetical protein Pg6A_15630 [Termitinemataceae bacterium]